MSKHPKVVSPTEMENSGFLGETTQVGLVTDDLYGSLDQLIAAGIGPWQVYEMTPENSELFYKGKSDAYSMKLGFTWHGAMMWEVIEPTGGESIYQDFLDSGVKGIHHVIVECNGVPYDEKKAGLEARGFAEIQSGVAFGGNAPFAYFHNGNPDSPILEIFNYPEGFEPPPPDEWYPAPPPAG
jgi:methylmalonyl-CoA/ethylmalonyl-CoA epimerase